MIRSQSTALALFAACTLTGFSAFSQQAAGTAAVGAQGTATVGTQTGAPAQADPNAAAQANQPGQMGMALPTATVAAPIAGTSDHDAVVGHWPLDFSVGLRFQSTATPPCRYP